MIVFDQVVDTDYGQFDIIWDAESVGFDGDFGRFFAGQVNGLVGAGETEGVLAIPAGTYRVRVCSRGRDAGAADEFADEVVDHYLVQFWPSPPRPDAIIATTSADAQYWHREITSRAEHPPT